MNVLSSNLNLMIKAGEKASKRLIRDFGEVENLQVSIKGPTDFVSNADINAERIIIKLFLLLDPERNLGTIWSRDVAISPQ